MLPPPYPCAIRSFNYFMIRVKCCFFYLALRLNLIVLQSSIFFFFALWKEQEGRRGSIQMVLESLRGRDWPLFTHLFSLPLGHKVQSVLPEFPAITICGM